MNRHLVPSVLVVLTVGSLAAGLVAACRRNIEARDPSLVGVVASRELRSGSIAHVVLKSGEEIDIHQDGSIRALQGGTPDVGDLLLYGDSPEPWFVALPSYGGSFKVSSQVDDASDGSITLDFGLRLPLAPTYREIRGPFEPDAPVNYIVNERGQVTERS